MTVRCPNCKTELDAPEEYVGQQVECPQCGHAFTVRKAPSRVAVPSPRTQGAAHSQKKKKAAKPLVLFSCIGAAVLLAIACLATWFLCNKGSMLTEWARKLPRASKGLTVLPTPVSYFMWVDHDFSSITNNTAFVYPSYDGNMPEWLRNDNTEYLPLSVVKTIPFGGMEIAIVKADRLDDFCKFASAFAGDKAGAITNNLIKTLGIRESLAVAVHTKCVVGDSLPRGVYAYYGVIELPKGETKDNRVHLFVQTYDNFNAVSEDLVAKRKADEELRMKQEEELRKKKEAERLKKEKEEEEAEERKVEEEERKEREEEALAELKKPVLDGLFGIKFGDVIKSNDTRFKFLGEAEQSGCIYSYSMPKPFLHLDFCQVYTTPKTHKVFMVQGGITAAAAEKFDVQSEWEKLRIVIKEKYKVEEEDDDDGDAWTYPFRNNKQIIVYKEKLEMAAIDLELHKKMQEETKAKKMQSLKSDIDTL